MKPTKDKHLMYDGSTKVWSDNAHCYDDGRVEEDSTTWLLLAVAEWSRRWIVGPVTRVRFPSVNQCQGGGTRQTRQT